MSQSPSSRYCTRSGDFWSGVSARMIESKSTRIVVPPASRERSILPSRVVTEPAATS
ncbi:MAG: hypothetical protein QM770_09730 [Tepidisphaeraceae bacterium]